MMDNNSLSRMLAILDVFAEDRLQWTSEELMASLGYSRPTLYRYLKILKDNGFLAGDTNSSFTLGPRIVEMDFLLRRSDPLLLKGRPYLLRLTERYPCASFLARWYGGKVLCIHAERSATDVISSYPRGRPMPVGRGATSHAILAFLPMRQLVPLVESCIGEFEKIGFGRTVDEILKRLREFRRNGVAIARGEVTPGMVGIGAPVFSGGRAPIACLTLTIQDRRVDEALLRRMTDDIRHFAAELSQTLIDGYTQPRQKPIMPANSISDVSGGIQT